MRISDWSSDVCSSDLRLVERLHAAIEDDLELREVALQGIDHLVAQRRHLAVLLRAESAQPGLAGVDREGTAAGGGKRFYESLQRVVAVLLVHADAGLHRHRNVVSRDHGSNEVGDASGLGTQAGAAESALHPLARAAEGRREER